VTTQIFEIDVLPDFLRYGVPLSRLRRAGDPLLSDNAMKQLVFNTQRTEYLIL